MAALASGTFSARLAAATGAAPARAGQRIPYGACVNTTPLLKESEYRIALETYCQQLTPEYGLFWDYLRPARDQFNFDFADKVLAFAEINEMTMRGHTLVWYGAMPNWTKEISSTAEAERELTGHIEKVVARYRTWSTNRSTTPEGPSARCVRPSGCSISARNTSTWHFGWRTGSIPRRNSCSTNTTSSAWGRLSPPGVGLF